jgi:hypothetical protein
MSCAELLSPTKDNSSGENCPFWTLANELRRILTAEAMGVKRFQAFLNAQSPVIMQTVLCL